MFSKINVNSQKGFTLVELMIVIALIGILTALASPYFITYRMKGYNTAANIDIKNAYTASQAYFTDYSSGTINTTILSSYGLKNSPNVNVSVINGVSTALNITSTHNSSDKTYTIDSDGDISSN